MPSYIFIQHNNSNPLPVQEASCNLIYIDPPTNRGMNEGGSSDRLPEDDYWNFTRLFIDNAIRCMCPDSYLILFTYDKLKYKLYDIMQYKLAFDQELIWHYNFGLYTRRKFVKEHDSILVYRKGKPKFYWEAVAIESQRLRSGDIRADQRGKTPGSVWDIPLVPGNSRQRVYLKDDYKRSCQPELLIERIIKAYTKSGDIILDMFCGTGSVTSVARRLNRFCISIDICPHYLEEAKARLEKESLEKFIKL